MNDELIINEEFIPFNKHYIIIDINDNIIKGWSDGLFPSADITNAICINEKGSYQFRLFPNGEENPNLFTEDGISLYKYEEGQILQKSETEIKIEKTILQNKNISQYQEIEIKKSKQQLADFLEKNPYAWIDGQQYTVTQDKQSLLTSQIALYIIDQTATLHWNAQGQPCTIWQPKDLAALAKAIEEYVRPYITYQQQKEVELRACETVEELNSIVIDYNTLL